MRVPGTFCIGAPMYSLNTASPQVMPSLIFASAPASWQGMHHLRKVASGCASALPAEATTSNEANIQVFILDLLFDPPNAAVLCERMPVGIRRVAAGPQLFEWRLAPTLSTPPAWNLLRRDLILSKRCVYGYKHVLRGQCDGTRPTEMS